MGHWVADCTVDSSFNNDGEASGWGTRIPSLPLFLHNNPGQLEDPGAVLGAVWVLVGVWGPAESLRIDHPGSLS